MIKKLNIILLLIIIILVFILSQNNIEGFNSEDDDQLVPKVEFPFKNILDENGRRLNIILISAPFREEKHEELYLK